MNIVKYFKNLSILAAAGLAIANTGLGDPHFEFEGIGPYKNDVLPLIQKIRELASNILCKGRIDNAQKDALEFISKQSPDGRNLNRMYDNSIYEYEQGIKKQHVEKYHTIDESIAKSLRQYDGQALHERIWKQYASLARPEKKVRSCVIGDWSKFISNIDFNAGNIKLSKITAHNEKPCDSIIISVPYKGEIIVLDNDNKLHFIKDGKEKFATFVIDLYRLGAEDAFWVVSTIYPWTWIAPSINETPQPSIDTISSQDKPSIEPKTNQIEYEKPFASLLFDEDDSEGDSIQSTPLATLEEAKGSELPTLETIEFTQDNVEIEQLSSPKKKAAKAKKQNLPNKPSINEKQLRIENKSDIEESALNGALGSKGTAQNQILELNENDAPVSIEAGAIKIFASVLSQEQLAYILLHTIKNGGDLNIVKCLIEECHCDVNIQDNNGHTALYYASALGHIWR